MTLAGRRCLGGVFVSLLWAMATVWPAACQANQDALIRANREIGVSFAPSLIAYREYVDNAVQDSERGWIPGFGVKVSVIGDVPKIKKVLLDARFDFNDGSSNHSSKSLSGGGTLSYAAPFRSESVLLRVGKGWTPNPKLLLAAQAEVEYRYWLRKLPQALLAIREDYTFWAPGGAMRASHSPIHVLVMKATVGADYTISPTLATIGNPFGQVPNLTFALGTRPLWRVELEGDWAFSRTLHGYAACSYSHFGFGNSVTAHYGNGSTECEPSSVTDLANTNVGLAWSF